MSKLQLYPIIPDLKDSKESKLYTSRPTCVQSQWCGGNHFSITVYISENALVHPSIRETEVGDLNFALRLLITENCAFKDDMPTTWDDLLSIPDPHY